MRNLGLTLEKEIVVHKKGLSIRQPFDFLYLLYLPDFRASQSKENEV